MTDKKWEQRLVHIDCEDALTEVVSDFCNYIIRRFYYCSYTNALLNDYHRELRGFIDPFCRYGHFFTEQFSRWFYSILEFCVDITIFRKLFSYGMQVYVDDDSHLITIDASHMVALVEADEKYVYVKDEIEYIKDSLTGTWCVVVQITIDLNFLIEALV